MNENELLFDEFLKKRLIKIITENKTVFSNFSEDDSQDYLESIKKVKRSIDKRKSELNAEFTADYFFEKRELELIILQHLQMHLILETDFGLKLGKKSKKESNPTLLAVANLMHQMNNNLVVFYKLLSDGFSFQANLILRSTVEQGSTIFEILLDDNFLEEYKRNGDIQEPDEKLRHWRNKLSPGKINGILTKKYSEIESLQIFKEPFFEFKKWLYQDSSEFVHSQFLPSLMSSYSSKKGEENYLDSNIMGRIDSNIERVCLRAIPYFNLFFDNFMKILIARFDYRFGDSNKDEGVKLWLVHKLTDELGKEYILQKRLNNDL